MESKELEQRICRYVATNLLQQGKLKAFLIFVKGYKTSLTNPFTQEFSADMNSRAVKRIEDVSRLRQAQFPEDAGSMAHPIRPDSYVRMGKGSHQMHLCQMSACCYLTLDSQ